jgi:hypothetical protein
MTTPGNRNSREIANSTYKASKVPSQRLKRCFKAKGLK